jgi:general secretion pathway protein H
MRLASSSYSTDDLGFTLLEMLVVIAIIAAAISIAMPAFMRPSDRLLLDQTLIEIRGDLRTTRSAAIATGRPQLFTIDAEDRSYHSPVTGEHHFSPKIDAQIKVAEPERISSSRAGIRFFPDGSATGGELTLSTNARQVIICVHWLTGQPAEGENCAWSRP